MKDIRLIGLCGGIKVGKTTVCDIINEYTNNAYTQISYATPIKKIASALTGIPLEQYELQSIKHLPLSSNVDTWLKSILIDTGNITREDLPIRFTQRQLLQYLGTELFRKYVPEFWINTLLDSIDLANHKYIVPDVRFFNEAQLIKDLGGVLIRIDRPGYGEPTGHSSESQIFHLPVDHVIINDGDLSDLKSKIINLMEEV